MLAVVTEEKFKKDAAKIPNVCEYFDIEWTDVEGPWSSKAGSSESAAVR